MAAETAAGAVKPAAGVVATAAGSSLRQANPTSDGWSGDAATTFGTGSPPLERVNVFRYAR